MNARSQMRDRIQRLEQDGPSALLIVTYAADAQPDHLDVDGVVVNRLPCESWDDFTHRLSKNHTGVAVGPMFKGV